MLRFRSIIISLLLLVACSVCAAPSADMSWPVWLGHLRQDAVTQGIDGAYFDRLFRTITLSKRVKKFDQHQPERRLTFLEYRRSRVNDYRIQLGRKMLQRYQKELHQVSDYYGVSPCMITALWGMESSYGRFKGSFPVITSLATLAFDSRRGDFFRNELLHAIKILYKGHVAPEDFKGEWAGASGHPQFLPSSWHHYAVDFNKDGRRDIWNTLEDVFASIANYLHKNGWKSNEPWGLAVRIPNDWDAEFTEGERSVAEWEELGVRALHGSLTTDRNLNATLMTPDGGPSFLVFKNFKVIMRYNRSTYYAGSVGYLADHICQGSGWLAKNNHSK